MTRQKLPAPRIEYWQTAKKEFNYRIIGANGKVIASHNQGFKRIGSLITNVQALGVVFGAKLNHNYGDESFEINDTGDEIPFVKVEK